MKVLTTIVEKPPRFSSSIKKIMDSREEFSKQIKNSKVITYSLEYFANCFADDPKHLKAIHVRLYNFHTNHRPEVNNYVISWEDILQDEEEKWNDFQSKVNNQLMEFLSDLKLQTNVIEGSL